MACRIDLGIPSALELEETFFDTRALLVLDIRFLYPINSCTLVMRNLF
jgi:hypothetical protein